jgi:hypothetical protein
LQIYVQLFGFANYFLIIFQPVAIIGYRSGYLRSKAILVATFFEYIYPNSNRNPINTQQIMKKLFLLTMLISLAGFSQQLKYGIGGRAFDSEGEKVKTTDVRELMKKNAAALNLYNVGRQKKTWGNALFYGGFGLAAINLITASTMDPYTIDSSGNYSANRASPALAIVGGAMVLASIPIKLGYTKKIKTALNEYNKGLAYHEKVTPEVTLLAGTQGLGVKIRF